jgi:integration host factor subunit beta
MRLKPGIYARDHNALAKGDRVGIRGQCSFHIKQYETYAGRNPKNGEKVTVKARKLAVFKAGTELKRRVGGAIQC